MSKPISKTNTNAVTPIETAEEFDAQTADLSKFDIADAIGYRIVPYTCDDCKEIHHSLIFFHPSQKSAISVNLSSMEVILKIIKVLSLVGIELYNICNKSTDDMKSKQPDYIV